MRTEGEGRLRLRHGVCVCCYLEDESGEIHVVCDKEIGPADEAVEEVNREVEVRRPVEGGSLDGLWELLHDAVVPRE